MNAVFWQIKLHKIIKHLKLKISFTNGWLHIKVRLILVRQFRDLISKTATRNSHASEILA